VTREGALVSKSRSRFESKQAMLLEYINTYSEKMRMPTDLPVTHTREVLEAVLIAFGNNLLTETTQPVVVAMFRLAISEAERSPEVATAIDACRQSARRAVADLLSDAQSRGLIAGGDALAMADRFLALLREDVMMSLLLGVGRQPSRARAEQLATSATRFFMETYASTRQR
jgi:AcrR family transcriptional regulator